MTEDANVAGDPEPRPRRPAEVVASEAIRPGKDSFSSNFVGTAVAFAAHIVLGMWFVRMLVSRLGPELYGLVPMITSLMSFLAIATMAINTSIGRHMLAELTEGRPEAASVVSSTALTGIAYLSIPVLLVGGAACGFLPSLVRVPNGAVAEARIYFALVLAGFVLTQVSIPFGTATFCTNRLDLRAGVDLIVYGVRTVGAYLFLLVLGNGLWPVGLAIAAAAGLQLWLQKVVWRRLLPDLRCRLGVFDAAAFRRTLSTSTWVTVNGAGAVLFLSSDLFLVNRISGPLEAGMYAPVLMLSQVIRAIAMTLGNLFTPKITRLYAQQDRDALQRYVIDATKFLGILIGVPIGILCALSRDFLTTWMGSLYGDRWLLVWLLLGPLCVNLSVHPQQAVQTAANKVRVPALVTLAMGVGHVCLAIVLAGPGGLGSVGVAVSGAIVLTAKNALFTPRYNMHILRIPASRAFAGMQSSLITTGIAIAATAVAGALIPVGGLPRLAGAGAAGAASTLAIVYLLLLTPKERVAARALASRTVLRAARWTRVREGRSE